MPGSEDQGSRAPDPAAGWAAPGSDPADAPTPDPAPSTWASGAPTAPGWGAPPPGWGQPTLTGPPGPPGWGPAPGWMPPQQPKGGDARTGPLPLHPMTLSDILDGAFKLLKANAGTIVVIVSAFVVPLQLLSGFATREMLGGDSFVDMLGDPSVANESTSTSSTVVSLVTSGIWYIVLPFIAGAISKVVAASYLGRELRAGEALRATLRRAWALFASWVLVHLLEVAGFLVGILVLIGVAVAGGGTAAAVIGVLLILVAGFPVLLAVMALSMAVSPAIVVEELGPIAGIRRSWRLMRRRFWPVLGIALLSGFLANVLGQVLATVPTIIGLFVPFDSVGWLLFSIGGILSSLVTLPVVAIVATLVYFDARIRTEGFDLEVIATELARG